MRLTRSAKPVILDVSLGIPLIQFDRAGKLLVKQVRTLQAAAVSGLVRDSGSCIQICSITPSPENRILSFLSKSTISPDVCPGR